jgi:DNA-binding LacI/PurR family transcriptional regulator
VDTVAVEMEGISHESTNYLIQAGHWRIAFVSTLRTGEGEEPVDPQIWFPFGWVYAGS